MTENTVVEMTKSSLFTIVRQTEGEVIAQEETDEMEYGGGGA